MARTDQNDTFYAGNKRTLQFTVYNDDNEGVPLDLTGLTFKWGCAATRFDRSFVEPKLVQKTLADGITVIDAAAGRVDVVIAGSDTTSLDGLYYHELEAFDVDSNSMVLMTGYLTILRNLANT